MWLVGIPGAGKSTIAKSIANKLTEHIEIIDSDNIRTQITPHPSWSSKERTIVYNAMVEICNRLYKYNISSIIAASSGGIDIEELRQKLPKRTFVVHVVCDLPEAAKRHPKNLYSKAASDRSIKMPILRSNPSGHIIDKDSAFQKKYGISGYKIVIPKSIDLEIITNSPSTLISNSRLIIELLKK